MARRAVSACVSPSVGVGAGAFVRSVCVLEAPVAAAAAVGVATTGVCLDECRSLVLCVRIERGEGTENTCGCHKGCKDEVFTFHDSVPCSCRAQLLMIVVSLTVYETTTHEVTCRVPFFSKKITVPVQFLNLPHASMRAIPITYSSFGYSSTSLMLKGRKSAQSAESVVLYIKETADCAGCAEKRR